MRFQIRASVLGLALLATACAASEQRNERSVPESFPFAHSGSRLKAMHYVAGSAQLFRTFHDQQLDVDCEWLPSAGGAFHCLPPAAAVSFLDAACEQPVIVDDSLEDGDFISAAPQTGLCPEESPRPRASYRVGMTLALGTEDGQPLLLYGLKDSKCQPTGSHPGQLGPPYIHVLKPVSEAELVAGHVANVSLGGGLSVRRIRADDGAELTLGVTLANGTGCKLQAGGRCVPGILSPVSGSVLPAPLYADANCEQRSFSLQAENSCGPADYGMETQADGLHLFALSLAERVYTRTEADGAAGAAGADGTPGVACELAVPSDSVQYARGKDVTSQFPLAQQRRTGEGPLFLSRLVAPDPARFLPLDAGDAFSDADNNACEVWDTHDSALRCLPYRSRVEEAGYFQDEDCKLQLYRRATDLDGLGSNAAEVPVTDLLHIANGAESGPAELSSLTAYDGALYQIISSVCRSAKTAPSVELFAIDQPLPLSLLPSVELKEL